MQTIRTAYQEGKLTALQAAQELTRWNGNPIAGNMQVVRRWAVC
jgi:hypothetical protein